MLSVQGKPGALEVADQREQPGHTQWEEEGQQVTNTNILKFSQSLTILANKIMNGKEIV